MTKIWYMNLEHMGELKMQLLSKQGILYDHKTKSLKFFKHCVFGKLHQKSFCKAIYKTKGTVDYIHLDYEGLYGVESLKGHIYFMSVTFMKHKSEAFNSFKEWKMLVESQTEKNVKRLRIDNVLE